MLGGSRAERLWAHRVDRPRERFARTVTRKKLVSVRHLLAVLALGVGSVLPTGPAAGPVDGAIDRELAASGVPGLAWAVVADGGVGDAGARGVVDVRGSTPVTADTPFLTGSVSKSVTALSVMQLVEAGRLDLDAAVSRYLPAFSDGPAGTVTLRQLLSHTSGWSTLQGNSSHTDGPGGADELARRVDALAGTEPAHAPGQVWEYSNANYLVLGRVVEVVSGSDYQGYVAEHVLAPVGMGDSFVSDGAVHPDMATGHRPWFGTKRAMPETATSRAMAPAGGVVASARDLARYLQVMMNGEDDVLSAAGKELMMQPAGPASPYYGLGWFVDPGAGTVWHTGTSPGYEATVTMLPAQRRGVVVLVNAGSGVGFGETTALRDAVTAAALGRPAPVPGSRLAQKALFVGLVLLPVVYLVSMVWAWRRRAAIRAKSGVAGLFSLWFPLLTTVVAAWVVLVLVPTLFGTPPTTLVLFQPDLGLALLAGGLLGPVWAVFRLAVAYTRRRPARRAPAAPGVPQGA